VSVELGTIVIDGADPTSLAQVWCDVLQWDEVDGDDDGAIEKAQQCRMRTLPIGSPRS